MPSSFDALEEMLGALGLSEVPAESFEAWHRGDTPASAEDPLYATASEMSAEVVGELGDVLRACGGAPALQEMSARSGMGERELLALTLALQHGAPATSLAAFRLHLSATARAQLHPVVLVGFVRTARQLADGDGGSEEDEAQHATTSVEATLHALTLALHDASDLASAEVAHGVSEGVCELLRGQTGRSAAVRAAAFGALERLLPGHAQTVFRALMPTLALSKESSSAPAVPRESLALQADACALVCRAIGAHGHAGGPLAHAVHALVQHSMAAAPDKAEFRAAVCRAVGALARTMPDDELARHCAFIDRLSRTAKAPLRAMACEGALELLAGTRDAELVLPPPAAAARLVRVVVSASRDKSTSVRTRAVGALGTLLDRCGTAALAAALGAPAASCAPPEAEAEADEAPSQMETDGAGHHGAQWLSHALETAASAARRAGPTPSSADEAAASSQDSEQGSQPRACTPPAPAPMDAEVAAPHTALVLAARLARAEDEMMAITPAARAPLGRGAAGSSSLQSLVLARCADAKPAVRRAAVSALGVLSARALPPAPAAEGAGACSSELEPALEMLAERCRDTASSVRKAAALALRALVNASAHTAADEAAAAAGADVARAAVVRAWLSAVGPLATDPEASVREVAMQGLSQLLLEPLADTAAASAAGRADAAAPSRSAVAHHHEAWRVLTLCERVDAEHLRRACAQLASAGSLPLSLGAALQLALAQPADDSQDEAALSRARSAAWSILETTATSKPHARAIDAARLIGRWRAPPAGSLRVESDEAGALAVIVQLCRHGLLTPADRSGLGAELLAALMRFDASPARGRALAHAYARVSAADGVSPAEAWRAPISACEAELCAHVRELEAASVDSTSGGSAAGAGVGGAALSRLVAQIFAVGEIAISADEEVGGGGVAEGASVVPDRLVRALEALAVPAPKPSAAASPDEAPPSTQPPAALASAGRAAAAEAAAAAADEDDGTGRTAEAAAAAGDASVAAGSSGLAKPAAAPSTAATPGAEAERAHVQAGAIVALGKLCGARPALAKRLVPVLVRELHASPSAAVRNNALFVLADLLKAFTALVDRHVPLVALAMLDPQPLVRFHTAVLLTRLLMTDYVRWKSTVLRVFALALVDRESSVREMATHCLLQQLLPRQPQLVATHVVELVAGLNGCVAHPAHGAAIAAASLSAAQEQRLQLAGAAHRARRAAVYAALGASMGDEARLQAVGKLTAEVLGPAADGSLSLAAPGAAEMLADTLALLGSKHMRVAGARGGGAGAAVADADEPTAADAGSAGARAAAARAKVLGAAATKHAAESIVPIAIELRRRLTDARSPLLAPLMAFLRDLVREHRDALAHALAHDKELAAEIEYDLRRGAGRAGPAPAAAPPPSAPSAGPAPAAPSPYKTVRTPSAEGRLAMSPEVAGSVGPDLQVPSVRERAARRGSRRDVDRDSTVLGEVNDKSSDEPAKEAPAAVPLGKAAGARAARPQPAAKRTRGR